MARLNKSAFEAFLQIICRRLGKKCSGKSYLFWQIFAVLQKIKNSDVVKHLGTSSTHTKAQK